MQPAHPQGSQPDDKSAAPTSSEQMEPAQTKVVGPEDTPPTPGNDTRFPVTFTGSGGEYFRIWIVNILLSILTLYVYSAWAKVRTQRYFAGNTFVDGSAFEYHATGMQILLGRIVAVALFIVFVLLGTIDPAIQAATTLLLMLVLPWVVWRSLKFSLRMTGYRNVRFGFSGSLGGAYSTLLVWPFLPLLIGGLVAGAAAYFLESGKVAAILMGLAVLASVLMMPWVQQKVAHYCLNGFRFGQASFSGTPSTASYYGIYLKAFGLWLLISTVIAAIAAVVVGVLGMLSADSLTAFSENMEEGNSAALVAPIAVSYLALFLIGFLIKAYLSVRIREHLLSQTLLDEKVNFESTMRVVPLVWLLVSNLLLLVVTLGLATPWTKVRLARYEAENTVLHSANGLHAVIDAEHAHQSSLGEEIGDAFDMDMDVGF